MFVLITAFKTCLLNLSLDVLAATPCYVIIHFMSKTYSFPSVCGITIARVT